MLSIKCLSIIDTLKEAPIIPPTIAALVSLASPNLTTSSSDFV
jgi:hypothetical protein